MFSPAHGYTFIGLNAIRALSIIAMLLVFSSTIFVMVTNIKAVNYYQAHKADNNATMAAMNMDYIAGSTVPNQPAGIFWSVVASLLIIFQTVILILSECSWPLAFFDHFFPVLGSGFGTGALGIFQGLIGAQILSHHVDEFTLVSAFFLFSLGCVNMFIGLIFRESAKTKRSITSWRSESKGVLPTIHDPRPIFVNASPAFGETPKLASEFGSIKSTDKASYGFGRQGEKAAGLRGFILQKPEESLPRYASPSPPPPPHSPPTAQVGRKQSTTSSFASPEPQYTRESVHSALSYDEEEQEYEGEEEEDEEVIHHAPVFKSSRTAL
jgi:hypothetical protein